MGTVYKLRNFLGLEIHPKNLGQLAHKSIVNRVRNLLLELLKFKAKKKGGVGH